MSLTREMDGLSIDQRKCLVLLDPSPAISDGTIFDMRRGMRTSCYRT
ncbi:protein of unknown function [Nitrospira defluvii]|uniref:Uncharacterized protein n=1 Tax=Nitrospira defluvii TaxID=330214 RepID=D8PC50_9BACT|nr:protein of unknown function [Nitrospira defluvii]